MQILHVESLWGLQKARKQNTQKKHHHHPLLPKTQEKTKSQEADAGQIFTLETATDIAELHESTRRNGLHVSAIVL